MKGAQLSKQVAMGQQARITALRALTASNARAFASIQKVPTMGDSISEGTIESFVKNVGEFVEADEVIARIETDKVTVDILSQHSGVITQYFAEEGDTVEVGVNFLEIDETAKAPEGKPAAAAPQQAEPEAAPKKEEAAPAKQEPAPAAPKQSSAPVTPPKMDTNQTTSKQAKKAPEEISGSRTETRVKMSRVRQTISRRLKEAQNTNAMLTTFNEIDMSAYMEMRKDVQDAFLKKHGIKLGFMSGFMKASTQALKEQPVVNAVIDDGDQVYRDFIDISTAVSTPTGLVVPVIRNCQDMGYADMEKALSDLALKGREGKLSLEDMTGGTFTITNGGVFGSMMGTPIINMPQSAILGMHATKVRPVVVGGQILARPVMYVALTYDHRIIDGREAVLFLRKIKECVEDPKQVLFDL
eukprot:CAMPEP_0176377144 /NCGR_PEP_ID=MMETSP0126-20121128/28682_1 /TAXON_ID=141414 ORGANISM="Strombidinopsis acuminatum, Strain SPMC142" /NCGR_SAMPLE_ID=MMETSP0126 /ASSEMBLY_ACC=CAM_ASM_000229 /LENGTH=413 /DNA_ID=CAMNT_0017738863 /DNA_START=50 /DNA_END=1291 /DNA_ORIENTATION=+